MLAGMKLGPLLVTISDYLGGFPRLSRWSSPGRVDLISISVTFRLPRRRLLCVEWLNRRHDAYPFVCTPTAAIIATNVLPGEYGGVGVLASEDG